MKQSWLRVCVFLALAAGLAVAIDVFGRLASDVAARLPSAAAASLPPPVTADLVRPTTAWLPERAAALSPIDRPFGQLHAWSESLASPAWAITVLLVALIVSVAVLRGGRGVGQHDASAHGRALRVSPLVTVPLAVGLLAWIVVSRAPQAFWDEAFVFASQARNLAESGVAGVAVSGPHPFAESSADVGITYVGGLLVLIAGGIHGETAVVLATLAIAVACAMGAAALLYRWFRVPPLSAALLTTTVVILQAGGLAAAASAFGTMAATGALTVLVLGTVRSFRVRSPWPLVLTGFVAGVIRWDYGFIALAALIVLAVLTAWDVRGRWSVGWRGALKPMIGGLVVAVGLLAAESAYRVIQFGAAMPSGVAFKRMGLDGAYLSSGISYLMDQQAVMWWNILLAVVVAAIVVLARGWRGAAFVALGVASAPMIASVVAGGDWFSPFWSRYVVPTAGALTILLAVVLVEAGAGCAVQGRAPNTRRPGVVAAAVLAPAILLVVLSVSAIRPFVEENRGGYREARLACLAATGHILDQLLPPGVPVATAEVNTIGYYSNRPLTDLIGLVDPRVAESAVSPLGAGDVLHRRRLPDLVQTDRPGAIYLFEGATCGPGAQDRNTSVEAWRTLLRDPITRYRIGDVSRVLRDYAPVTVVAPDTLSVNVLIRRDYLPRLRASTSSSSERDGANAA